MSIRIITGDSRRALTSLPDKSVHCCVTSPPYFGQRDYDVEGQMGAEKTPEEYVAALIILFREVWRVLRDDGTVWLNLGDSYCSTPPGTKRGVSASSGLNGVTSEKYLRTLDASVGTVRDKSKLPGLKPKNLIGAPWRVALALQADGWYLRRDIIWSKPNPMPESVTDRPTTSHEYIFLLTKRPTYYYDAEAIKEEGAVPAGTKGAKGSAQRAAEPGVNSRPPEYKIYDGTRNKRSVWTVATRPFAGAHFATFPPDLISPCIEAGTSAHGACPTCGAAWDRLVKRRTVNASTAALAGTEIAGKGHPSSQVRDDHDVRDGPVVISSTIGWYPSCKCYGVEPLAEHPRKPKGTDEAAMAAWEAAVELVDERRAAQWKAVQQKHVVKCVVLDPFGGAGTTALVADRLHRDAIIIELNPKYAAMAADRLRADALMFADISVEVAA